MRDKRDSENHKGQTDRQRKGRELEKEKKEEIDRQAERHTYNFRNKEKQTYICYSSVTCK